MDTLLLSAAIPYKYKNNGGQDLFGYPPSQFGKAAYYYNKLTQDMQFDKAKEVLSDLKLALNIEEISILFKQNLFKNVASLSTIALKNDLQEVMLELYSLYLNHPKDEIKQELESRGDVYREIWGRIVPDEDNVTPEQLGCFL